MWGEKIPEITLDWLEEKFLNLWEHTKQTVQGFEWLFQTAEKISNLSEQDTEIFCTKFEDICKFNPQTTQLLWLKL